MRLIASFLVAAALITACTGSAGPSQTAVPASPTASVRASASPAAIPSTPAPASASPTPAPSSPAPAATSPAPGATDFRDQMAWSEGEPTPDGCLVISMAEVSEASGIEVVQTLQMFHDQPGCGYYDAGWGMVMSTRFHTRATGEAHFAAELARNPLLVDGIGDQAIWIERGWQLWAWQADTLVMVGIGRIGETPARFNLAKVLAPLVVSRFR